MASDIVQKAVFGRSGNRCAFSDCAQPLVIEQSGTTVVVGELAHIVAKSVQGPRGHLDVDPADREAPENYVAFCRAHHKIVDAAPLVYSVPVLRAMKEAAERPFVDRDQLLVPSPRVTETLHSTMLWVQALPSRLFSAPTSATFEEVLEGLDRCGDLTPFVLAAERLWTFHDLSDASGPFHSVVDRAAADAIRADEAWVEPDTHRLYVNLLNRCVSQHLGRKGIRYDGRHRRYHFAGREEGGSVSWTYRTKSGRSQTREVVRQAKFRDGRTKELWWHLAVRLRFEQVAPLSWYLTVRPEFHLTKDGREPLESQRIGRRVTREKSTIYNEEYLNLVHFWRCVLSGEKPRTVLRAGQLIVIDTHLADSRVAWPGVPADEVAFTPDPFADDLFTLAEINEIDDEHGDDPFDAEWDESDAEEAV